MLIGMIGTIRNPAANMLINISHLFPDIRTKIPIINMIRDPKQLILSNSLFFFVLFSVKPARNEAETPNITVPAPNSEHSVPENPSGVKIVLKQAPKDIKTPSTSVKITSKILKLRSENAFPIV